MQLMLIAERAATATARATARAAADEASATIHILEAENKRLLLLLAAEKAATAASSPVPTNANGHTTHTQHAALANRSNSSTYAQAVMSSVPKVRRPTRNTGNDLGGDHLANAASSSATVGTEPAVMLSPTVLRHNPADNAEAAALQAAADAAAAAAKCNDRAVLRAVLQPPPPPRHWHRLAHKTLAQCSLDDEEEGRPRLGLGGRTPPGHADHASPQAQSPPGHQSQRPPALAPPSSFDGPNSQQPPAAPRGEDKKPDVRQELFSHAATALLLPCLRLAMSHPRLSPL